MNNIEKSFFLALALLFANMGHAQNQMHVSGGRGI